MPPVAEDDSHSVDEGETITVVAPGVLGNDRDADGDSLEAVLIADAQKGNLTFNTDGSFTYVHDGSESTADSFTYKADDGVLESGTATVSIQIESVDDPPVGVADTYTVAEGGVLEVESLGVLANDKDEEYDPLSARLGQGVAHGTLDLHADGSFTYAHDGGESEIDSFTYFANDGAEDSLETAVTISVTPVNDPPSIALGEPDTANEPADESFLIKWTDDDPDDNALVDLYYDTDASGFDGDKITQDAIAEDDETDRIAWDTSAVEEGVYFVCAVIDGRRECAGKGLRFRFRRSQAQCRPLRRKTIRIRSRRAKR